MTTSTIALRTNAAASGTPSPRPAASEAAVKGHVGSRIWDRLRRTMAQKLMVALSALMLTAPAAAQVAAPPSAPVGLWQCTVNGNTYGVEMEMQVSPDGTLYARGMVIYYGLQNPFTQVEGYGDWTLLPPDATSDQYMFTFRMFPQAQNHPIVTWHVHPAGQGIMYNLFQHPQTGAMVETQCAKFG